MKLVVADIFVLKVLNEIPLNIKKLYLHFSLVFFVYILDRVTKVYILHLSQNDFGREIFSSRYLNIFPIWNKGISFGLLSYDNLDFII